MGDFLGRAATRLRVYLGIQNGPFGKVGLAKDGFTGSRSLRRVALGGIEVGVAIFAEDVQKFLGLFGGVVLGPWVCGILDTRSVLELHGADVDVEQRVPLTSTIPDLSPIGPVPKMIFGIDVGAISTT